MSRFTGTSRASFLAAVLPGLLGLSLLLSACGEATSTVTSTSSSSAGSRELAFARCMRSHGVPSFPDPDPQGDFPPFDTGVSKQISTAANEACKELLPSGGGSGGGTRGDQQKLAFALQVALCMRSHGFPTYPDPAGSTSASQGSGIRFEGTGIDPKSQRFQSAENSCETHARQALGLP